MISTESTTQALPFLICCQVGCWIQCFWHVYDIYRACSSGKRQAAGNGIHSQDQLLSQSTDDQEEYTMVAFKNCSIWK